MIGRTSQAPHEWVKRDHRRARTAQGAGRINWNQPVSTIPGAAPNPGNGSEVMCSPLGSSAATRASKRITARIELPRTSLDTA